jgi:NADH-quinone oxidoreductase subunit F
VTAAPLTGRARADRTPHDLTEWRALGGYRGLERALAGAPEAVVEDVTKARLRGRGGAGFPAGKKWSFMPDDPDGPAYLCVNADEMEPGAFKDRFVLEAVPHLLVEGMLIAAYAIRAQMIYVFVRDAYDGPRRGLERAIAEARAAGYIGQDILGSGFDVEVRVHASAGRYICGEETALLEALEGKRPIPRQKPPYPAQVGLWGQPTTVNNVETLANVPYIVEHGADAYLALARGEDGGTKLFGVSGRVRRPGLYERAMGTPAGEVLEAAGGVPPGRALAGLLPGSGSSGFLGPDELDLPLEFAALERAGKWFGTGMMIVLDDAVCPVEALARLERFYARESCGFCTPCREGLPWTVRLLERLCGGRGTRDDLRLLETHAEVGGDGAAGACGLLPGATMPLASGLELFREAFEAHLGSGGCPWRRR